MLLGLACNVAKAIYVQYCDRSVIENELIGSCQTLEITVFQFWKVLENSVEMCVPYMRYEYMLFVRSND